MKKILILLALFLVSCGGEPQKQTTTTPTQEVEIPNPVNEVKDEPIKVKIDTAKVVETIKEEIQKIEEKDEVVLPIDCDAIPCHKVNGKWSCDGASITVTEGQEVWISLNKKGVGFSITGPKGNVYKHDYPLRSIAIDDTGDYNILTDEGCKGVFSIFVEPQAVIPEKAEPIEPVAEPEIIPETVAQPCTIIPEYRVNGQWFSGESDITLNVGDNLMLSMLPNGVGVNITTPNGEVMGDDYNLGSLKTSNEGTYVIKSASGCSVSVILRILVPEVNSTTGYPRIESHYFTNLDKNKN